MLFNYFKFLINFFFKKKFILINSPFQYINFYEYLEKNNLKYNGIPILIGFCSDSTILQIKLINKINFYNKYSIFFLKNLFSIKIFHLLLFLKKKTTGFDECIIGDINYYLFKEFYKYSNKNIILDDGTSSLETFDKERFKKNTKFFTIFKTNRNNIYIRNNLSFIKKNKKDNQKKQKTVYILGTILLIHNIIKKKLFINFLELICKKYCKYKIYYIPHRLEKKFDFLRHLDIEILKPELPIELHTIFQDFIPSVIISFYSTSLFSLKLIYNKKIRLYNFSFLFENILNKSLINKYNLIKKQLLLHKIDNFKY